MIWACSHISTPCLLTVRIWQRRFNLPLQHLDTFQNFLNRNLTSKTKVYKAVCYGCKSQVPYCYHLQSLKQFHPQRITLNWWDKLLHIKFWNDSLSMKIKTMVFVSQQLHYVGHIICILENWLPRLNVLSLVSLTRVKGAISGQNKWYMDHIRAILKMHNNYLIFT